MKPVAFLFLALVCVSRLFATPQAGDTLKTGDEELYVHGFTLSGELLNQVFEFRLEQSAINPKLILISSGNHKGFYAALVLEGDKLYVEKLWIDGAPTEDRLTVPFRKADDAKHLFASWFTGKLRHYYGERLPGYGTEHTHERVFSFQKGRLVSITEGETEQYRRLRNRTNSLPPKSPRSGSKEASQSEAQPDAAPKPPPAAPVLDVAENMNPKPEGVFVSLLTIDEETDERLASNPILVLEVESDWAVVSAPSFSLAGVAVVDLPRLLLAHPLTAVYKERTDNQWAEVNSMADGRDRELATIAAETAETMRHSLVVKEVECIITAYAATNSFNLVLDRTANPGPNRPVVLYSSNGMTLKDVIGASGVNDITREVLKVLTTERPNQALQQNRLPPPQSESHPKP